jgi:hypothetical protein
MTAALNEPLPASHCEVHHHLPGTAGSPATQIELARPDAPIIQGKHHV